MGRRWLVAAAVVLAAVVLVGCDGEAPVGATSAEPTVSTAAAVALPAESEATSAVVTAANAFIAKLTGEQRAAAVLGLDDPARGNWSNLPAGSLRFERNGVRIGDLDLEQTDAMHHFLASALSPEGYRTVLGIVRAEDVLAESRAGDRSRWSADNYWLAFFGEPSESGPWGWQFGGHHLAVNVTVVGGSELSVADVSWDRAGVVYEGQFDRRAARAVFERGSGADQRVGRGGAGAGHSRRTARMAW